MATYEYEPSSKTSWRLATQQEIKFYNCYGIPQDSRVANTWEIEGQKIKTMQNIASIHFGNPNLLHEQFPPSVEPTAFKISKQSSYKPKELKLRSLSKLNINN